MAEKRSRYKVLVEITNGMYSDNNTIYVSKVEIVHNTYKNKYVCRNKNYFNL